jgi:predicted transcriptional regulator
MYSHLLSPLLKPNSKNKVKKYMKTIKQIADELGVSKQAVRKHLSKLPTTTVSTSSNRTTLINSSGEAILKTLVVTKVSTEPVTETPINDTLYSVLKAELEEKNKQISALIEQNTALIEQLDTSQRLHAGTMQQQLTTSETPADEVEVESSTPAKQPVEPIQENEIIVNLQKQVEELQEQTCFQSKKISELNKKRGFLWRFGRKA